MRFKAIIFDMDGTITDTTSIWNQATKELIAMKGVPSTDQLGIELCERMHGLSMTEACKFIKDSIGIADPLDKLIEEKTAIACNLYRQGIRFIEGFEDFHAQVTQHNLKSGIATNADDSTLTITKEVLALERFFGYHIYNITCVNNIAKPDPALYLHAANQLGVSPDHCLAIEDSAFGIQAAKRAGMFCIGINTSRNYEHVKESDLIIDKYCEIDLKKLLKTTKW
jgi:beta-phosphoglucomutase